MGLCTSQYCQRTGLGAKLPLRKKKVHWSWLLSYFWSLTFLFGSAAQSSPKQTSSSKKLFASLSSPKDYLIKLRSVPSPARLLALKNLVGPHGEMEQLTDRWIRLKASGSSLSTGGASSRLLSALRKDPRIEVIQPNYPVTLMEKYKIQDPLKRAVFSRGIGLTKTYTSPSDNPPIPSERTASQEAWVPPRDNFPVVVAVVDTGVDYTHGALVGNVWRNPGEMGPDSQNRSKENNHLDDEGNGFIDDVIGWDFIDNDNKPYDLTVNWQRLLIKGGNPGHGTHCAGNLIAQRGDYLKAPTAADEVRIMSVRFLTEEGTGKTANAIKAIKYAIDNGAKILSTAWISAEERSKAKANKALQDIILYAQEHGVLFVAAAGNGRDEVGYNNDVDPQPSYPASYAHENIISVATIDGRDQLENFSNWGAKAVHIGAPGVDVFSALTKDNKAPEFGGFAFIWEGTSMAAPYVAGATALYWSMNPAKTWREIKAGILAGAKKIPSLIGKVSSEGKLDLSGLL